MFFFLFAVSAECLLPLQKWYYASPYSASECRNRVSDRDLLSFSITIIFLIKNNQDLGMPVWVRRRKRIWFDHIRLSLSTVHTWNL